MFCNYCGRENPDGVKYCNYCGQLITAQKGAAQETDSFQQRKKTRNSELIELERMIRHFSEKTATYAEYDRLGEYIRKTAKGKHHSLLVWGIIVLVFGAGIMGMIQRNTSSNMMVLLSVVSLLPGVGMIVGYVFYSRNFDKNIYNAVNRYEELSEELYAHYEAYGACSVGAEYTNPANLQEIRATIESGRADTIKEAINILVDDAHRNNMRQIAEQTARSSAAAARGATVSAVFSAANFFKNR